MVKNKDKVKDKVVKVDEDNDKVDKRLRKRIRCVRPSIPRAN